MKTFRLSLFLVVVAVSTNNSFAQSQAIRADKVSLETDSQAFSFDVQYSATNDDRSATGVGFVTCFDSGQLTFVNVTNERVTHRVVPATEPVRDLDDSDGDAKTDMCFSAAYFDLVGNFPNEPLPLRLFSANFVTKKGFDETAVNFAKTSNDAAFKFESSPVKASRRDPRARTVRGE